MATQSVKNKQWQVKAVDAVQVEAIAAAHQLPALVSTLLAGRGVALNDVDTYLHPQLSQLPSPFLLKDAEKAVGILADSIADKDHIVLYGDYDVDGVTAVSVVANFLTELNIAHRIYHPNRINDGYGLKASVVRQHYSEDRPGLLITCDCGISDEEEVAHLIDWGWKVIVTDHHQPPETIPKANAVINPWQHDCQFPFNDLAGVGVAFFLVMALRTHLVNNGLLTVSNAPNLKNSLDIVAIGTICDMVEVKGVNRILVKAGLEVMANTNNHGLARLMEQCGISGKHVICSDDISFKIGPRLNAPGRMGDAGLSSNLLTSANTVNSSDCIRKIEAINNKRRDLTFKHITQAMTMVHDLRLNKKPCIVVYSAEWHLGVIGIVASKLLEEFSVPAIALCGEKVLKGSVRSVEGLNFHDLLIECSDILIEYGGHSAACGFSVESRQLETLTSTLYALVSKAKNTVSAESILEIDYSFTSNEWVTEDVEKANARISPYGFNNFEPIYSVNSACELRNIQFIGKEKTHLRFQAKLGNSFINAIGFGFADAVRKHQSKSGSPVKAKIAFSLRKNFYNSRETTQLFVHDLILAPAAS